MANKKDAATLFSAFLGPRARAKSKFEENGKKFLDYIRTIRENPNCPIYHHQIDAVVNAHKRLVEEACNPKPDPVLIVAPTGSGKSGMIFMLPYVLQARKVLVLTPSTVISEQLGETFGFRNKMCFLEKVGACQNQKELKSFLENGVVIRSSADIGPDHLINLVIVNAQKFGGRSKTTLSLMYRNKNVIEDVKSFFKEFDLLIVDEAHHYPAVTWVNIVKEFQKSADCMTKQIIFLTATPNKTGKDGSVKPILPKQRIVYEVTSEQLRGTTIRETEFVEKTDISKLRNDIKKLLARNAIREPRIYKHQGMILVRTKKEAEYYEAVLNDGASDFAVALVSDKTTVKQDTEAFSRGRYTVAVTCGLLKEGYDNSSVTVCVILRNVQAKVLFDQFIGRCMRKKKMPCGSVEQDQSIALILSYKKFSQKNMWDEREALASEDPIDVDDD